MMKKLLSLLMLMPLWASAQTVEIDGIWYTINSAEKNAEVTSDPSVDDYIGCYSGSIKIPNEIKTDEVYIVTKIGDHAFSGCNKMTSIEIPNSVNSIGYEAFMYCNSLKSVNIPNSVTTISNYAFGYCGLTSVTIPNSVTRIEWGAFEGCSGLTSITIPSSVISIENQAFHFCNGLTSFTFPNGVKSIGREAFEGCKNLTTITIPQSMTFIDEEAFSWCYNLTDVYCLAEQLADYQNSKVNGGLYADSDAFVGSMKQATLHVPAGSVDAYRAVGPWKSFKAIVAINDDEIPTIPKCAAPVVTYANGKVEFTCETEGVEFVSNVIVEDAKSYHDSSITFSQTYKVTVYATKEGYENSDVVTKDIKLFGGSDVQGDVDGDGKVNVADHVKLSEIIMNQ